MGDPAHACGSSWRVLINGDAFAVVHALSGSAVFVVPVGILPGSGVFIRFLPLGEGAPWVSGLIARQGVAGALVQVFSKRWLVHFSVQRAGVRVDAFFSLRVVH